MVTILLYDGPLNVDSFGNRKGVLMIKKFEVYSIDSVINVTKSKNIFGNVA